MRLHKFTDGLQYNKNGRREGEEGEPLELVAASNESTGLLNIREGLEKETHEGREKAGGESGTMKCVRMSICDEM